MAEVQRDDQLGNRESSALFIALVQMFAQQTLMQLGKIASPITQKAERDLPSAEVTIGLLEMLEEKTKGNLNKEEQQILRNVLTDLRLNFVEEAERAKTEAKSPAPGKEAQAAPESAPNATAAPAATPSADPSAESKVKFHKKYE